MTSREQGTTVLEGEIERITYENTETGFRIIKLAVAGRQERLAVVGSFQPVGVGTRVRVRGKIVIDPKYGEQLRAESVTELSPNTLVGIEKYLGSGLIKGIGQKYAARIVATFGLETLRVLDEAPERLAEVLGLGHKRAQALGKAWKEQRALRDVMVFLQAHGASSALAGRIFKRYGPDAVSVVSCDPYRLAIDVWGVGFATADRIAQELGVAKDSPARMQAGALQVLRNLTDAGHTYAERSEIVGRAAELLELDPFEAEERIVFSIDALVAGGHVVIENVHGAQIVFPAALFAAEARLSKRLVEVARASVPDLPGAADAIRAFEARAEVVLAPEQRRAVELAARSPLLVVTGGPGVGKTTIVRAILAVLDRAELAVRLAAPTGRAAKRMQEATGREASTLHRLLEFEPRTAKFKRDASRPIEAGAIIVDETSMVDVTMGDALLQAVLPGTRLLLVGDVDQLASVGPGAVLRDAIGSGAVPYVRLTRIFRQGEGSLIIENAHRINAGEAPVVPAPGADADFFVVDRRDPDHAQKTIVDLVVSHIPRRFGLDPVRDVQVLTPMHRGPAGSLALNEALQAALNPHGPELVRGTRTYRLGDKVMQLRNDYDRNVYNGDLGIVSSVDTEQESLVVRFDEGRDVPYDAATLDELVLAYAISIHKSQGSEYPAVVVPLLTTHFVMLSKNLLYTAVTRGKRLVVVVADPRAVKLALSADRRDERRTRLAVRLSSREG